MLLIQFQQRSCVKCKWKCNLTMPVILGPSGSASLKAGIIRSWKTLHELRNIWTLTSFSVNRVLHPQMRVKAVWIRDESTLQFNLMQCEGQITPLMRFLHSIVNTIWVCYRLFICFIIKLKVILLIFFI